MDYEIYQAETGHRKQYLVFGMRKDMVASIKTAMKYFKCSAPYIFPQIVWVNGKDLYLENPHKKGFHKRYALSYYSNRRKV